MFDIAAVASTLLFAWGGQDDVATTSRVLALMNDAAVAREFDYYSLKASGTDLPALENAVSANLKERTGVSADGRGGRCVTEAEQEVLAGLRTAGEAADAETWRADREAAAAAIRRWRLLRESVLSGDHAEPPYVDVAERVAAIGPIKEPRKRALMERVAIDQFMRSSWVELGDEWLGALSPGARMRVNRTIGGEGCRLDQDNAAWIDNEISQHGWYVRSAHGDDGDTAAWLIVQHADRNPSFQQRMLEVLEPLVAAGESQASNYAYLFDRVAVNTGQPQRYATQGRCTARNVWTPLPLEAEDRVDMHRVQAGLQPYDVYRAEMNQRCADFGS